MDAREISKALANHKKFGTISTRIVLQKEYTDLLLNRANEIMRDISGHPHSFWDLQEIYSPMCVSNAVMTVSRKSPWVKKLSKGIRVDAEVNAKKMLTEKWAGEGAA